MAIVPSNLDHVYDLWIAWGSAALLHLVVLQVPLRRGIPVMLGWAVLMTVGLYAGFDHVDLYRMHPLVSTGVGEAVVVMTGLVAVRRLTDQYRRQRHVVREVRRRTARVQVASQLDHFWSGQVTGSVMPLLRQVADGIADPADPSVAARARSLETALRDELTLGPERAPVIAEFARLRQAGWEITSPMPEPGSEDELDATLPLLRLLGQPCRPGQCAMVSTLPTQATLVVLGADEEQCRTWLEVAPRAGVEADVDPDFVRRSRPA